VPGIIVYEADFVRDQTKENFANGPIEIKSLVAKTANASQAAEQFTSSRQALTSASPAWVESDVAKLGDEATGLTMEGTSSEGPAVAHLYLFRRGAMVVGITVAGLTKPTRMAEAEAIAAVVLRKIDPSVQNATGERKPRPLNARGAPTNSGSGSSTQLSASSGPKVRVANTDGSGLRLRAQPSLTAAITARLAEGTVLDVVGEDKQVNGVTWKNVKGGPGNHTGWVSAQYVVSAAGGGSATTTSTTQTASSATATPGSSAANSGSAPTPPPSTSATGESLKINVSVKKTKVAKGQEQTVDIVVSKNDQPVSGAQVTVKTNTGETPNAPPTDGSGKTSVSWKTTGSPGFIGVGVSAVTSDGSAGVGGASFEITN
jgi:hypothetical protein